MSAIVRATFCSYALSTLYVFDCVDADVTVGSVIFCFFVFLFNFLQFGVYYCYGFIDHSSLMPVSLILLSMQERYSNFIQNGLFDVD
jgi:hypothetical protein